MVLCEVCHVSQILRLNPIPDVVQIPIHKPVVESVFIIHIIKPIAEHFRFSSPIHLSHEEEIRIAFFHSSRSIIPELGIWNRIAPGRKLLIPGGVEDSVQL